VLSKCLSALGFWWFLCLGQQQAVETLCFPVDHRAVHLCIVHLITATLCDAVSLYLTEGFQWNLSEIFVMWVGIAEKLVRVRGQMSRSLCIQMCKCYNGVSIRRGSLIHVIVVVTYRRLS